MPRRKYKVRLVQEDQVYDNVLTAKLINIVMKDGKKETARKIIYDSFAQIKEKKQDPTEVLTKAVENIGPYQSVKPRRIGGASYMVPKELTAKHRQFLALKWLVEAATARSNKEYHSFTDILTAELMDAYEGKGAAVEKKQQTHKLAEANKVFAHFAW